MPSRKPSSPLPASDFVLGEQSFAKINAVEGIHLKPQMLARAADAQHKHLDANERRATIIESYRKRR